MSKQRNYENKGPRPGGKTGIKVYQSKDKLLGIAEHLGCNKTLESLGESLGIRAARLHEAANSDTFTSELLGELEEALKRKGKVFDRNWREFRIPEGELSGYGAERPDMAPAFVTAFGRANPAPPAPTPSSPVVPAPLPVLVTAGTPERPQAQGPRGFTSIAIKGSQWGRGSAFVEVTLSCSVWNGATIRRGLITLDLGTGSMTDASYRGWVGASRTFKTTLANDRHDRVVLSLGAATPLGPEWRVIALGSGIGTFWVDPDFAALEQLAPGTKVTATFGTWLSDIDEDEGAPAEDSIMLTDSNNNELKVPMEELSKRRRKIIAALRKTILNAGPDGYVELVSHALPIVEKTP